MALVDSDEEQEQLQFKIILLGDGAVGKTSLAMRFTSDTFSQSYKQTLGLDFFVQRLELPGDISVTMQIWDIGGQSIGSKMIKSYIYNADAVVLAYDITNYSSFQNLEDWYRLVQQTFDKELPYTALIGNKIDLSHMRTVKLDHHVRFAQENDMTSFQVSAKTGDQVRTSFYRIAADLAGVTLTRPEIDVTSKVVAAEIVNHRKDDPRVKEPKAIEDARTGSGSQESKKKKCVIQ